MKYETSINDSSNNKRIAKNTLLLYFRMLLMMVVTLYTSRGVSYSGGGGLWYL